MTNSTEQEPRESLWNGVPLRQALRDQISRSQTGYLYEDLKEAVAKGEDLLENEEVEQVDRLVNVIAHMFLYYSQSGKVFESISKHKTTIRREKKGEPSFMEVVPLDKIREILS